MCGCCAQTTDRNLWISAVSLARRQLGISGFTLLRMGTPLYALAVQIHAGPRFKFVEEDPSFLTIEIINGTIVSTTLQTLRVVVGRTQHERTLVHAASSVQITSTTAKFGKRERWNHWNIVFEEDETATVWSNFTLKGQSSRCGKALVHGRRIDLYENDFADNARPASVLYSSWRPLLVSDEDEDSERRFIHVDKDGAVVTDLFPGAEVYKVYPNLAYAEGRDGFGMTFDLASQAMYWEHKKLQLLMRSKIFPVPLHRLTTYGWWRRVMEFLGMTEALFYRLSQFVWL